MEALALQGVLVDVSDESTRLTTIADAVIKFINESGSSAVPAKSAFGGGVNLWLLAKTKKRF